MAGFIARQPWRLGIILCLPFFVGGLLSLRAFFPGSDDTGENTSDSAPIVSAGSQPQAGSPDGAATTGAQGAAGTGTGSGGFTGYSTLIAFSLPSGALENVSGAGELPKNPSPIPLPLPFGSLSGLVWQNDYPDGPLDGISVYLFDADNNFTGMHALTAQSGAFDFPELIPGSYQLFFADSAGRYEPGWLGGDSTGCSDPEGGCWSDGAVDVQPGEASSVSFRLLSAKGPEAYGAVSGRVTDSENGAGIAGVTVFAFPFGDPAMFGPGLLFRPQGAAMTDAGGNYRLGGLPPAGSDALIVGYKIFFAPPSTGEADWVYVPQWYQDQWNHDTAKIIWPDAGDEMGGVDAILPRIARNCCGPQLDGPGESQLISSQASDGTIPIINEQSGQQDVTAREEDTEAEGPPASGGSAAGQVADGLIAAEEHQGQVPGEGGQDQVPVR